MHPFTRHSLAAVALLGATLTAGCSDSSAPDDDTPPIEDNVLAISAGGAHSCALRIDGAAFCWGRNVEGQLGDGTNANRSEPVRAADGFLFRAISAGDTHTCAITSTNQALCWGDNLHGQVGGGGAPATRVAPTLVSATQFASVSSGQDHSCGISVTGEAWCWGQAYLGNDSTVTRRATPVQVRGGPWNAVSASVNFTCGLRTTGAAYCWGTNAGGVLGIGTGNDEEPLPTIVAGNRTYHTIETGIGHACAVATSNAAWCWGANSVGQLGTGSAGTGGDTPVAVTGGTSFTGLALGELHSCGTTALAPRCWGRNSVGQLGTNDNMQRTSPTAVLVESLVAISSFRGHNCGLTTDHEGYCWGANAFGQIGNGSTAAGVDEPHRISLPSAVIPALGRSR